MPLIAEPFREKPYPFSALPLAAGAKIHDSLYFPPSCHRPPPFMNKIVLAFALRKMVQRRNQKRKQDGVSRHTRQARARRSNKTESEEERESLDPIGLMRDSSLSTIGEDAVSDSINRAESSQATRGSWQSSQPESQSSIQDLIDTIVHIQPPPLPELVALWLDFLYLWAA
ncbi:uncharacterized protein UMAG_05094 [Mycosarcoma maydis]|uniref:Uncharacterized protein n=1 Tax=Mycosarcoma maydis TaxID=5270 RepID=A0A0D1E1P6_MYCMD|nr:uncharacterized protein UMAG_05094 [Ustilago maydis 521]KIS70019.1 hypothetical protein UMAG_05094 [Ustilago maydis 521]|eukprot:XP_011388167.1 hypothetical protein UMAG_05094 [Ustilago maydis 521]